MKKGAALFWIAMLLLIALCLGVVFFANTGSRDLAPFAQCLKDKGAIFYGAFWCPHCQKTKALFGAAASKLPYVECSTPNGQGQTQVCKDKGIQGYPTWTFANSTTTLTGEHTLQELAAASGCPLPSGQ